MNYTELFTPHHIATLADWLEEKGQIFLQIELPHSGGSGLYHTVRSLAEIKRAVAEVRNPEIEIIIWKNQTQEQFESDHPLPDDLTWIYQHSGEVMYLAVKKNRAFSAAYMENPQKYQKAIDEWPR